MRIIGYLPHDQYLITIFQMDDKYSIQIEKGLLVQTYKYRSGAKLSSLDELKRMIGQSFIHRVDGIFLQMEKNKVQHLPKEQEEDFDEII